jgi:hypothetical protein
MELRIHASRIDARPDRASKQDYIRERMLAIALFNSIPNGLR